MTQQPSIPQPIQYSPPAHSAVHTSKAYRCSGTRYLLKVEKKCDNIPATIGVTEIINWIKNTGNISEFPAVMYMFSEYLTTVGWGSNCCSSIPSTISFHRFFHTIQRQLFVFQSRLLTNHAQFHKLQLVYFFLHPSVARFRPLVRDVRHARISPSSNSPAGHKFN